VDKAGEAHRETFVIDYIIKFYRKKFVRNRKQFLLTLCTDNSECGGEGEGKKERVRGREKEELTGLERDEVTEVWCFRCCSVKAAVNPTIKQDRTGVGSIALRCSAVSAFLNCSVCDGQLH
jgi:hypothetical protein